MKAPFRPFLECKWKTYRTLNMANNDWCPQHLIMNAIHCWVECLHFIKWDYPPNILSISKISQILKDVWLSMHEMYSKILHNKCNHVSWTRLAICCMNSQCSGRTLATENMSIKLFLMRHSHLDLVSFLSFFNVPNQLTLFQSCTAIALPCIFTSTKKLWALKVSKQGHYHCSRGRNNDPWTSHPKSQRSTMEIWSLCQWSVHGLDHGWPW